MRGKDARKRRKDSILVIRGGTRGNDAVFSPPDCLKKLGPFFPSSTKSVFLSKVRKGKTTNSPTQSGRRGRPPHPARMNINVRGSKEEAEVAGLFPLSIVRKFSLCCGILNGRRRCHCCQSQTNEWGEEAVKRGFNFGIRGSFSSPPFRGGEWRATPARSPPGDKKARETAFTSL